MSTSNPEQVAVGASTTPLPGEAADEASATSWRVVRNATFLIAQPLLLNVISIAVTGYIARSLGAGDFGRLNFAFAMSALFASFAGLGIGTVTVRDLVQQQHEPPQRYLGRTLTLRLLSGVLAYGALVVAVLAGGLLPEAPWAVLLAGTTIFSTLITVSIEDLFRAREQMQHIARIRLISGLTLTSASVAALLLGGGLFELVLVYAGAQYVTLVLAAITLVRKFFVPRPGLDLSFSRRVVGQGLVFFAGGVMGSISQRVDKLILERMQGAMSVGEFSAGASLVEKLAIIPEGLGGAVYPALAGLVRGKEAVAREVLGRFLSLAAMVGLPIALGGSLVAEPLIQLIFGEEYDQAITVFAVAVWTLPAWSFGHVLVYAIAAIHRERLGLAVALGGTATLVGGNLVLVPMYGSVGSALALTISQWLATFIYLVLVMYLYRGAGIIRVRQLLITLLGLALMAAAVLLTRHLPLFVPVLLGAAVYGVVVGRPGYRLLRQVRQHKEPPAGEAT